MPLNKDIKEEENAGGASSEHSEWSEMCKKNIMNLLSSEGWKLNS